MQAEFQLEELKLQAIALLRTAGFAIDDSINVEIDEKLKFMGYTTEENGKPKIVVAGFTLKTGGALNLLIHELSHVYRSQTKHPSHNYEIISHITGWVTQGMLVQPYQQKILHAILNHLQDLYADDISFAVFKKNNDKNNLSEFFMTWIRPASEAKDPEHRAWENAEALLSASFAQANLRRHEVPDSEGKVESVIKSFLNEIPKPLAEKYEFFQTFMLHLPEEVTDKEYESFLIKYLNEFLKLTKLH